MSRKLLPLVLGIALLAPAVASAWAPGCTPGFWRNKGLALWCTTATGTVEGMGSCSATDIADLIATVQARFGLSGDPALCSTGVSLLTPPGGSASACPDGNCPRQVLTMDFNLCFFPVETFGNPCPDEPTFIP